jgi:predicted nucleic acid-binding protein
VFLQLAAAGGAGVLVTGDADLLELAYRATFAIEAPASFKRRFVRLSGSHSVLTETMHAVDFRIEWAAQASARKREFDAPDRA